MGSDSSGDANNDGGSSTYTSDNYENEAFGGVGNNQGYTAPGNFRSSNPTDTSYKADRDNAISQLEKVTSLRSCLAYLALLEQAATIR